MTTPHSRPSEPMLTDRFSVAGVFSFMGGALAQALLFGGEGVAAGGDFVWGC
jgi:hypothetical protein